MSNNSEENTYDIAIVGMALHVPGASNVEEFWSNLREGVESVEDISEEELLLGGVPAHELYDPNYVKSGAFLSGLEDFDAEFFGLSPKDAAIMDPQHRHFLECSWEALEHANLPPSKFDGSIGVFGGCGMGTYMLYNLATNQSLMESVGFFLVRHTGNDKDFLTTRVSYCLDLQGPSINVQTACSTSLVATHMACQSLISGECDLALAGGVTIELPHRRGYVFRDSEILSPDGHCRAFDHKAEGTIFGSGAGVVVLRRIDDALDNGDKIYAVIKGSAINNDGSGKVGYLAPSVDGQAAAIAEALAVSDVEADTIDYVEAHGTGTAMGDPIEIAAFTQAYKQQTDKTNYCGIGSVKTNIGHLDTAAGVVGLIKATLSLQHREIPPSLNWEAPNPKIDFENSPFYVNHELTDWPQNDRPGRAAINSLGVGGTNAHLILEEAPVRKPLNHNHDREPTHLLRISGRTSAALKGNLEALHKFLLDNPEVDLGDVAHTLKVGRHDFIKRSVLACASVSEAIECLGSNDKFRIFSHTAATTNGKTVFLLPGGGAQYVEMAAGLYHKYTDFRIHMDKGFELAVNVHDLDLERYLFPSSVNTSLLEEFEQPSVQLPAIFLVEYALAQLWFSYGVKPDALLGHSMGENTAACLAGVMSFEDAFGLVCLRGKLFDSVKPGGMLSVAKSAAEVRELMGESLDLAVENGPEMSVVSGEVKLIETFADELTASEIEFTRIKINIAAHSRMLEPILEKFRVYLQSITLAAPKIPFLSNRTGDWISEEEATSPDYWVDHLRKTILFSSGVSRVLEDFSRVLFIEVGPGSTLTSLVRLQEGYGDDHNTLNSLRHRDQEVSDEIYFLSALGRVWASGFTFDDEKLQESKGCRTVNLPTYAFQRQHYWIEPGKPDSAAVQRPKYLTRLDDFDDWFSIPVWEEANAIPANLNQTSWLIFVDEIGFGRHLAERLREQGEDSVVEVSYGSQCHQSDDGTFNVRADPHEEDYEDLAEYLDEKNALPTRIIHLWSLTTVPSDTNFKRQIDLGFYSHFFLLKALAERDALSEVHLITVTNGARQVASEALPYPEKSIVDGPCRSVPREVEGFTCTTLDLELDEQNLLAAADDRNEGPINEIHEEIHAIAENKTVTLRNGVRYELSYKSFDAPENDEPEIVDGATYMITGGLGGVGLTIAEALARNSNVNLLLISRSGLAAREDWPLLLSSVDTPKKVVAAISGIRRLEALGSQVMTAAADITDSDAIQEVVEEAESSLGSIRGVIHAAGALDDGLLPMKTIESMSQVLAPKIFGTRVLDKVFSNKKLDFFVMLSSTSTVTCPLGQIDYVAANTFLNAFACSRTQRTGQATIALNWGVWNEIGMAIDATQETEGSVQQYPVDHPILRLRRKTKDGWEFYFAVSSSADWLLDEHRLKDGGSLLPGTSFLDLARTAFLIAYGEGTCVFENVNFSRAFAVPDDVIMRGRLVLRQTLDNHEFAIQSWRQSSAGKHGWLTHADGTLRAAKLPKNEKLAIEGIYSRCAENSYIADEDGISTGQGKYVQFGPRWHNVKELHYGTKEAMARIELPAQFTSDMSDFLLHPALLDMATGCAMELIEGYGTNNTILWFPISYEKIEVFASLESSLHSWIRLRGEAYVNDETAAFDVSITDQDGRVLLEINNFLIQKSVSAPSLPAATGLAPSDLESGRAFPIIEQSGENISPSEIALRHNIAQGILPEEGMRAFNRVISAGTPPVLVVSSLHLGELVDQVEHKYDDQENEQITFGRPALDSDYVAPDNPTEIKQAEIWQQLLGVEQVGSDDDFFELGGHSLLATRLLQTVRKELGVKLPIRTIFDRPTLASFSQAIIDQGPAVTPALKTTEIKEQTKEDSGTPPATAAQIRFWYLDNISGTVPAYNNVVCLSLEGKLDRERLQHALDQLVVRHEIFRTSLVLKNDQLQQDIHAPFAPEIEEVQVGDFSFQRVPKVFEDRASAEFDLSAFPLFRITLAQGRKDQHALLLTFHHCVCDGWTLGRIPLELAKLYAGEPMSDAPRQYREYKETITAEEESSQLAFWRQQLKGEIASLELPTDHSRPASLSANGTNVFCMLPAMKKIHEAAREVNVTPYAFLLGVFHILCAKWSGVDDFCIGAPFSLREEGNDDEEALGPWLNTIVLRIPPADSSLVLGKFLNSVKDTCLDAYDNRDVPFERVLEDLRGERDSNISSLFQVVFALDDTHTLTPFKMGNLSCQHLQIPIHSSRTDLSVWMTPTDDGIEARFEYSTDLFDHATIERFVTSYQTLLEAALQTPDTSLGALPLIDAAQAAELTNDRNRNWHALPEITAIHSAFEEQVDLTPEAIAAHCDGDSLSYAELDQRANRLAHQLLKMGAGQGEVVGLSVPRSNDMLVGLLAILKTGAAYLPLDPEYPSERLAYMLEDAGANILIGNSDNQSLVKTLEFLELDQFDYDSVDDTRPTVKSEVEDLAYVIYTSGSTGKPKGVMVEHRNVCNFFSAMDDVLEFQSGDGGTLVAITSISFDISVLELFWGLSRGLTVVLQTDDLSVENSAVALILKHNATYFQCTPSQARLMLAEPQVNEALGGLKKMLVGGEALPVDIASQLLSLVGGQLVNVYGPTETTIWSAYHSVREEDQLTVPIGGPILNTALYVLDERLNPVPAGVIGELYIGGDGVVRGYLGNENLTVERFLDDPFREQGGRMYRTGDTVRYREDGTLQFCGRTDHQVKLRGHRIELGEVETRLTEFSGINEVVCVVREDQPGDQRLVAYVCVSEAFDEIAVRSQLAEMIPDYMVPNTFIILDTLPLTPNGKIDRKSLPMLGELGDTAEDDKYVAPRNDIELRLSIIWQELLGVSRVGIRDSFFELGGHSLLTLQLASRIAKEFKTEIQPAQMFALPILEEMAEALSGSKTLTKRALVPIKRHGEGAPIYCMCGINLYRELAESLGDDQPFLAMYVPEEEAVFSSGSGSGEDRNTVKELASAYYMMIREQNAELPLRLIGFCFGGAIAFEVALLAEADGIEVEHVILLESVVWSRLKRKNVKRAKNLIKKVIDEGPATVVDILAERRNSRNSSRMDASDVDERLNALASRMAGYEPHGKLKADIILIGTDDQAMYATWKVTPLLGWEGHFTGNTHVLNVKGSHTGLLVNPVVKDVGHKIQSILLESDL